MSIGFLLVITPIYIFPVGIVIIDKLSAYGKISGCPTIAQINIYCEMRIRRFIGTYKLSVRKIGYFPARGQQQRKKDHRHYHFDTFCMHTASPLYPR